ncbi:MAG: hypothetical protein JWM43_283 [Acidobacteriaceae bacterium]|nr:hypothetical protein [Acidobacteriaceae bacterium]
MKRICIAVLALSIPSFAQTIDPTQVRGTAVVQSPSGPQGTKVLNNVLWADQFPGADIGAKVMAAIAQRGSSCGLIEIAPGDYNQSTQIVQPRCITIDGNNAHITWTGTDPNVPAWVNGSVADIDYTQGGIRNLQLIGNANATGMYFGSKVGSYVVPTGISDYLETFENVSVKFFKDNYVKGSGVYQLSFLSGESVGGDHSNWLDVGVDGSENMMFTHWQSLNSSGWGFYSDNLAGATYNFNDCSFDYNALGMIYYGNGTIHIVGGHMEGPKMPYIDGPNIALPGFQSQLVVSGGTVFVYSGNTTASSVFKSQGQNNNWYIGPGLWFYHPGGDITKLIDWQAAGASNQLTVGAYSDPSSFTGVTFPAVQAGANIQWLDIPIFTQYVPTGRIVTAEQIISGTVNTIKGAGFGMIGAYNNSCPSAIQGVTLPYAGNYMGWNCDGTGGADFYNPYINGTNLPAFHFRTKLADGTFTTVGEIYRGGWYNSPSGFMYNGNYGFTGTKTAGSCIMTIQGGIITNVTGC